MAKKTVSAKIDEDLLAEARSLACKLSIPLNQAFAEGLTLWVSGKTRELLAEEMKKASYAARKESLKSAREWS